MQVHHLLQVQCEMQVLLLNSRLHYVLSNIIISLKYGNIQHIYLCLVMIYDAQVRKQALL